jgi:hypothetical protein
MIPASELEDLEAASQRILLVEQLQANTGGSYDTVIKSSRGTSEHPEHEIQLKSMSDVFSFWRSENLKRSIEDEIWCLVPLYAATYPGSDAGNRPTLWELLDGLATDTVIKNGQYVRRLWLETRFSNIVGTPLFSLAVKLWKLRDQILLPLIRLYHKTTDIDVGRMLENSEAILDNKVLDPDFGTSKVIVSSEFLERVNYLHEQSPKLRENFEDIIKLMKKLGRAIANDNKKIIDTFYR